MIEFFDLIATVWQSILPVTVIDCYERGIVLRLGKPVRDLGPGLHFIIPIVERVESETVVRQTSYLDVQSLTSADGKPVTLCAIIVYRIADLRRYLLEIDDGETDLQNIVYGLINDHAEATHWKEIRGTKFNRLLFSDCKRSADDYCGVELISIKWADKATARNLRLWND